MTFELIKNQEKKTIKKLKLDYPKLFKLILLLDYNSFKEICGFYCFLKYVYEQIYKEIGIESKTIRLNQLKDTIILMLNTFYNSNNIYNENDKEIEIEINKKLGNNIMDLLPFMDIIPFIKTLIKLNLDSNIINKLFDNILVDLGKNRFKNWNELNIYLDNTVEVIGIIIFKIIYKNNKNNNNNSNSKNNSKNKNNKNIVREESKNNISINQIESVLTLFCKSLLLTHLTKNIKYDYQNPPNKIFIPLEECVTNNRYVKFDINTYLKSRIEKLNNIFRIEQDPIFNNIILKQIEFNRKLYKEVEIGFDIIPKEYQSILKVLKIKSQIDLNKIEKEGPSNIIFEKIRFQNYDTLEYSDYLSIIYELGFYNLLVIFYHYFCYF